MRTHRTRLEPSRFSPRVPLVISPDSSNPEPMNYGMLGEDDANTEEKLAKYTGRVRWSYLAPHHESGSLYFVDPGLKLETVGAAFTANDSMQVEQWLKSGDLVKIEVLHARQWENTDTSFEALVVSPFVLCRPA